MKNIFNFTSVGLVALLLTGCATYSAQQYSTSSENVSTLQSLGNIKVNVGNFTSTNKGLHSIVCRAAGKISPPGGYTYAEFVRKAIIDELSYAKKYSTGAAVTLTGNLDHILFSSTSGEWHFTLTVTSSNGQSLTVADKYDYRTSFFAGRACAVTATALTPAVQSLIKKLFSHPEFKKLVVS